MLIFAGCFDLLLAPPSQTNWLNPWHEILHDWNARVARCIQEAGVLTWSQRSLQQYWHLCSYIAGLPDARWVSRILVWRPRNTGKRGAPFRLWHSAAEIFCRWKGLGDWKTAAMNTQRWHKYTAEFCSFIFESLRRPLLDSDCANACAFSGLPGPMRHWFTGFTHSLWIHG